MTAGTSFLIALVPAAHIWWTGRRLVNRIDDPGSGTYIHAAALGEGSLAIAGAGEDASRASVLTVFPPGETSSSR